MAIAQGLSNEQFRREFFKEYPNFYSKGFADINSLTRADRRNEQFTSLLKSGQLLPVANAPSSESLFLDRLKAIGAHGLLGKTAKLPQEFIDSFNSFTNSLKASRNELSTFAKGAREGTIMPFTTSDAQRTRLIDKAQSEFGRILDQSTEQQFGELSRRGLLPSSTTGVSGPANDVLSRVRAQTYEQPLTSFVRDLDIQTEADLVANRNALRNVGVNVEQFLAENANSAAQTAGNFGLGIGNFNLNNLNAQRSFADALLSQLGSFEDFNLKKDAFERDQRLQGEALFEARDSLKKSKSNSFLGSGGGSLIGAGLGALLALPTGGLSVAAGAGLGSSLGGNVGNFLSGGQLAPMDFSGFSSGSPALKKGIPVGQFAGFAQPRNLNPNIRIPQFSQTASFI